MKTKSKWRDVGCLSANTFFPALPGQTLSSSWLQAEICLIGYVCCGNAYFKRSLFSEVHHFWINFGLYVDVMKLTLRSLLIICNTHISKAFKLSTWSKLCWNLCYTQSPTHLSIFSVCPWWRSVADYKYLGVHIDNKLDLTLNSTVLFKKGRSRLYFLRRLKSFNICNTLLRMFYESVVSFSLRWSVGEVVWRWQTGINWTN